MLSASAAFSAVGAPTIEFAKTTVNFGKILRGQKTTVSFPFKNTGKGMLAITKVSAGCGCTKAKATKTQLKPGQTSDVKVVFDSKDYAMKIMKSIYVISNDPANPSVHLHITGEVQMVAEFSPPSLDLGNMTTGDAVEKTITVTSRIEKQFTIVKIVSDGKQVTVSKFDKVPGPDGTYSATVKVVAGTEPGRLMEHLAVTTDLPGLPPIRYIVYGNVLKPGEENEEHP